jgi:hypothetical protein
MVQNTLEIGKMVTSMVMELRHGLMVLNTLEIGKMVTMQWLWNLY